MNIIGIDTSSKSLEVAITNGKGLLLTTTLLGRERTSKTIIVTVKSILESGGLSLSDLNGISIITGPGSFTGLKLGMSMAKILAYLLKIPVLGLDLFEIIGFHYRYLKEDIGIILPSRKGEFYYSIYLSNGLVDEYGVLKDVDIERKFKKDLWIYSPYRELEKDLKSKGFYKILPGWEFIGKAYAASLIGLEKIEKKNYDNPFTLSPFYIRRFPF